MKTQLGRRSTFKSLKHPGDAGSPGTAVAPRQTRLQTQSRVPTTRGAPTPLRSRLRAARVLEKVCRAHVAPPLPVQGPARGEGKASQASPGRGMPSPVAPIRCRGRGGARLLCAGPRARRKGNPARRSPAPRRKRARRPAPPSSSTSTSRDLGGKIAEWDGLSDGAGRGEALTRSLPPAPPHPIASPLPLLRPFSSHRSPTTHPPQAPAWLQHPHPRQTPARGPASGSGIISPV